MDRRDYIENFAKTCKLARQTGAPILEVNFSCPNFGKEGLVCFDMRASQDILEALHKAKGNTPLLVKIGYFGKKQKDHLDKLLNSIHKYADGVVAINTIPANVVDKKGQQVLPGNSVRLSSGTCGATIRWAGFEMAKYIVDYKQTKNWKDFAVIGVGGVVTPKDYFRYMKLGVDAVQSATGAMWNPSLALEIRTSA
jgi:dihydroorotate dehydrogenase (NAD+) catalytic subunit